jgi:hypothetical protein
VGWVLLQFVLLFLLNHPQNQAYQGLMVHVFGRLAAALFIMRDKMITNER